MNSAEKIKAATWCREWLRTNEAPDELGRVGRWAVTFAMAAYEAGRLAAEGQRKAAKGAGPVRYVLCPGRVGSRTDGQRHYVSAQRLAQLYELRSREWETWRAGREYPEGTVFLHPRFDGRYGRPEGNL